MMARPRSNSSPSDELSPNKLLVRQSSDASTAQIGDSRSNSPGQDLPILRIDGAIKGTQSDEALNRQGIVFRWCFNVIVAGIRVISLTASRIITPRWIK